MSTEKKLDEKKPKSPALPSVTLSDGRVVTLRAPLGEDFEKGSAATGGNMNPITMMFGMVGQVAMIGEAPLVYEEIRLLPFADAMALVGAVAGKERSPALEIFSSSSATPGFH